MIKKSFLLVTLLLFAVTPAFAGYTSRSYSSPSVSTRSYSAPAPSVAIRSLPAAPVAPVRTAPITSSAPIVRPVSGYNYAAKGVTVPAGVRPFTNARPLQSTDRPGVTTVQRNTTVVARRPVTTYVAPASPRYIQRNAPVVRYRNGVRVYRPGPRTVIVRHPHVVPVYVGGPSYPQPLYRQPNNTGSVIIGFLVCMIILAAVGFGLLAYLNKV